jgi:membrane peptidoglycan carboxypeptidase
VRKLGARWQAAGNLTRRMAARGRGGDSGRVRVARLLSVLVCGVLAGLLLATAVLPAAALVGLPATLIADAGGALPGSLLRLTEPQASYVYASDGTTLITTFYDQNRHDVPLSAIAPVMRRS